MHQALYRRFRPETLEGLLGQEHIVKILENQIANNTVGHAYLFCGTRGTGKTTTARILAKGVNCTAEKGKRPCGTCESCVGIKEGIFLDVIEIDAASNNGVENIRELRESVKYPPVKGRCKVYIIDEVHMLSTGAFNALLKTLEEPPSYVMFILATTEPQKLPATILSRCLRLDFRRVSEKQLIEGMAEICGSLNVTISNDALGIIAANGDGSVRDSLSILDQCITGSGKEITRQDVLRILGSSGDEVFIKITDMVHRGETAGSLILLDKIISDGIEVKQFMKDWIVHYRNLMMTKFILKPENIINVSEENIERIKEQSAQIQMSDIDSNIIALASALSEAKWSTQPRILLELCIVKMATRNTNAEDIAVETSTIKNKERNKEKDREKDREKTVGEKDSPIEDIQDESVTSDPKEYCFDLEDIWERVAEEGESKKGTFNMLTRGCRIGEISCDAFRLELANPMALRYANDNAEFIIGLLEKQTGKKLRMDCCLAEGTDRKPEKKPAKEIALEVENRLNISVEVIK